MLANSIPRLANKWRPSKDNPRSSREVFTKRSVRSFKNTFQVLKIPIFNSTKLNLLDDEMSEMCYLEECDHKNVCAEHARLKLNFETLKYNVLKNIRERVLSGLRAPTVVHSNESKTQCSKIER